MNKYKTPLANTIEEAEAFARRYIIGGRGIVNYRSFDLNIANLINTTLYEMVGQFSVRLRAVGTEKDLYLFSRLLEYCEYYKYCDVAKDLSAMRVRFNSGGSWARSWVDGIFFKEDLWKDDAHQLRKRIEEAGPRYRKCSSLESLIVHEYAHVLDPAHTKAVRIGAMESLLAGILTELTGHFDHQNGEENGKIIRSVFGDCADSIQEMWAEAVACYFEEKSGRAQVRILDPAITNLIDKKVTELIERNR